jgi:hypothetical protein
MPNFEIDVSIYFPVGLKRGVPIPSAAPRHHSTCDLIDGEVPNPCNYCNSRKQLGKFPANQARDASQCARLPETVHMKIFPDIVLTRSTERHLEMLARERRFSDTFATCRRG